MTTRSRWHIRGLIPVALRDAIWGFMGQGYASPIHKGWELRVPYGDAGKPMRQVIADLMNTERARVSLAWSAEPVGRE